jgi:hypothetical protein
MFEGELRSSFIAHPDVQSHESTSEQHYPSMTDSDLTDVTRNLVRVGLQTSEGQSNSRATPTSTPTETFVDTYRSRSSTALPVVNTFDSDHRVHPIETNKGLLSGTSFDALMDSLRRMREKDLDIIIENGSVSPTRFRD